MQKKKQKNISKRTLFLGTPPTHALIRTLTLRGQLWNSFRQIVYILSEFPNRYYVNILVISKTLLNRMTHFMSLF